MRPPLPMLTGTVLRTGGGAYRVELDGGAVVEASLRGRVKLQDRTGDRVVIGDRVRVEASESGHTIEEVLPRRTQVVRRGPGGRRPKVVAANMDHLLAVVAAADPEPRLELVDRLLVVGEAADVPPVLVVNKVDLDRVRAVALAGLYGPIGYRVLTTSAETGEGLADLRGLLCHGTAALVGPSGVGKSSLLNRVQPGLRLRIGGLSRRRGSGTHTTVNARLVVLECGGRVADTPGFSDVGVWGVEPAELEGCFPEFVEHAARCRFRACTHTHEPDCGVVEAVENGEVARSRYESYVRLRGEAA